MDIYWRDACICPTEDEYKKMVNQSEFTVWHFVNVIWEILFVETAGLFKLAVDLMQLFSENKR